MQGSLGTELGPLGSLEKEDHRNSLKICDAPSMAEMNAMEAEVCEINPALTPSRN